MENDQKPMTTKELTQAVSLLLQREEERVANQNRRRRRRVRHRRKETHDRIVRLTQSIEIIKWCIVGITTVMAASLLILIMVVWEIGNEVQRIKGEVEQIKGEAKNMVQKIEHEADMIRDKIQHPLRTLGGALGGQIEQRIGGALGLEE